MKILVSGSHGLVGSALIDLLTTEGHEVVRLVRSGRNVGSPEIEWHPDRGLIDSEHLEGLDAVVHLAGESIASGRWTSEKKRAILESRVNGTQLLSESLAKLSRPPAVFLSASGIGYYGSRGDEQLTEQSASGDDFLAHVCREWENATTAATEKGIRTVIARFGIILDAKGGALAQMLTPFRMGVGGRVGSGKQWMSWIALEDVVRAIRFLLRDGVVNGPVNFVSPFPVTNAEFTKTLGQVLSRPTMFPIPAFGVRVAFGEMGDALLLSSQKVEPAVLQARGYAFLWPRLEPTLRKLLHREYAKA
ncbi:MAG TPA: TIGR01777 family oxidoreductase [Pyrinomonadaceae bacterium]|nr:TIGR01777 family oxidoreductase [Pyrinomonadaceae bacterium]